MYSPVCPANEEMRLSKLFDLCILDTSDVALAIADAFGAVIDSKSPYTGGHSNRVGSYAVFQLR